jgi:16S rRNA processing protein RimM
MEFIPIGRVLSTHGIGGEVKFRYYNEVKEDISSYTSFFVLEGGSPRALKPERVRFGTQYMYLLFEGLDSPEKVLFLRNQELLVRKADLPPLPEDSYYDWQLIGLAVLDPVGRKMGEVTEVVHTSTHEILVVQGEREFFVPMVEEFIAMIDVQDGAIRVTEAAILL